MSRSTQLVITFKSFFPNSKYINELSSFIVEAGCCKPLDLSFRGTIALFWKHDSFVVDHFGTSPQKPTPAYLTTRNHLRITNISRQIDLRTYTKIVELHLEYDVDRRAYSNDRNTGSLESCVAISSSAVPSFFGTSFGGEPPNPPTLAAGLLHHADLCTRTDSTVRESFNYNTRVEPCPCNSNRTLIEQSNSLTPELQLQRLQQSSIQQPP